MDASVPAVGNTAVPDDAPVIDISPDAAVGFADRAPWYLDYELQFRPSRLATRGAVQG